MASLKKGLRNVASLENESDEKISWRFLAIVTGSYDRIEYFFQMVAQPESNEDVHSVKATMMKQGAGTWSVIASMGRLAGAAFAMETDAILLRSQPLL